MTYRAGAVALSLLALTTATTLAQDAAKTSTSPPAAKKPPAVQNPAPTAQDWTDLRRIAALVGLPDVALAFRRLIAPTFLIIPFHHLLLSLVLYLCASTIRRRGR